MVTMKTLTCLPLLFLLILVGELSSTPFATALAVSDDSVRCAAHPNPDSEVDEVCVGYFTYYWEPDWYVDLYTNPDDFEGGWWWIYNFVDLSSSNEDGSFKGIGEQVVVRLQLDEETCEVGLGGDYYLDNYAACQSCTFCGFSASGPDERNNGQFTADCTNIPGGRMISNCENTFPFYYPVDWYDPAYGEDPETSHPETMDPSDEHSTKYPETMDPSDEHSTKYPETMDPSDVESTSYPVTSAPTSIQDTYCVGDLIYDECGDSCPPTCSNAIPLPEDGGVPCNTYYCTEGCFCPPDKPIALDGTGTCVASRDECPTPPPIEPGSPTMAPTDEVTYSGTVCGGDLVFITCGGTCHSPSCNNRVAPETPCTEECISGCYCPAGQILVDGDGICVSDYSECPPDEDLLALSNKANQMTAKPPKQDDGETATYDLKSHVIVTLFPGSTTGEEVDDGMAITTVDVEFVLDKLEQFFTQWLAQNDQLSAASVDLVLSTHDPTANNDVINVDLETKVIATFVSTATSVMTEREMAVLLTEADFGYFISKYLRHTQSSGLFQKAFRIVYKVVGSE